MHPQPSQYEQRRRLNPALRGFIFLSHFILIFFWILSSPHGLYQILIALQMTLLDGHYIEPLAFLFTWLVTFIPVTWLLNYLTRFASLLQPVPTLTRLIYGLNGLLCCVIFLMPGTRYLYEGHQFKKPIEISLKTLEDGQTPASRNVKIQAYALIDKIQTVQAEGAYSLTYKDYYIPLVFNPAGVAENPVTLFLKVASDELPKDLENLFFQKDKTEAKFIFIHGLLSQDTLNFYLKNRMKNRGIQIANPHYVLDFNEDATAIIWMGETYLIGGGILSGLLLSGFWIWFRKTSPSLVLKSN